MEHVSLETAKRLKEAGWSQDENLAERKTATQISELGYVLDPNTVATSSDYFAAPSTDELLEALPDFDLDGWMLKDITPERLAQIWLDSRP